LFLKPPPGFKQEEQREMLRWEKDLVGLYLSDHPLNALSNVIPYIGGHVFSANLKANGLDFHGKPIAVAGIVIAQRQINTKNGDPMAIITVEDPQGTVDAVFFPRSWAKYRDLIHADNIYIFRGKADSQREGTTPSIIVDSVAQDVDIATSTEGGAFMPNRPNGAGASEPPQYTPAGSEEPPPLPADAYESYGTPPEADHTNENGAAPFAFDLDEEEADQAAMRRRVTLVFDPPTGDPAKWRRKLQQVRNKLIQVAGTDMLAFLIHDVEQSFIWESDDQIDYEAMRPYIDANFAPDHVIIEQLAVESE
jgi:hypothetical protein